MKNGINNNAKAATASGNLDQPLGSGAKGSEAGVRANHGGIEDMLQQLHQILAQITQSISSDHLDDDGSPASKQQLITLANQLATNLQEQDDNSNEAAMQDVLQIIDTLADMLDNGQIAMSTSVE